VSFAEEMGKAQWGIIWLQLVVYAAIAGALGFWNEQMHPLTAADFTLPNQPSLPPATIALIQQIVTLSSGFGVFLGTLLGFFVFQGISFGLARLFKGHGSFLAQCYTVILFQVPLGLLGALLAFVPILGIVASSSLSIFNLVLQVFSVMAIHRLSGGKATGVVLIPIGVIFLLLCCVFFVIIATAVNNVSVQP
jgi:hypothetical protein